MRIALRTQRHALPIHLTTDPANPVATVAAPNSSDQPLRLDWEHALDDQGQLQRCPACGCRELFARRDFPQATGMAIVVLGAIVAVVMFATGRVMWGFASLGSVALIDALILPFTKRCLVCYRCRSEFRGPGLTIPRNHPGWDLATGEKYRQPTAPAAD